jgi:DNA-binding response OmpR family regulator
MAQSILIVDDEKEIVSMLYCYFSKLGYTVYTATAGNAALKEVEKKPDIILLDVNMPDIDGFTVCERIRDYVSCPIIFLTARIEDSDKIKGFSIGADDYVIKPFSVDELEDILNTANIYPLQACKKIINLAKTNGSNDDKSIAIIDR